MFFAFAFLALKLLAVFSLPRHNPAASSQSASHIRELFAVPDEKPLVYPPVDVKGPKPRAAWVEAYHRVKLAGLIPKNSSVNPQDSAGLLKTPNVAETSQHPNHTLKAPGKIFRAPAGMVGLCFDDGPQLASMGLLTYLTSQSQIATHFLIGTRILRDMATFKAMDMAGQHHGVHTYTHPRMPWLTDEEILGEIGWTMQLIHDHTSGHKIPKYWRPPYGQTNDRVEAIAWYVFGLETVMWQYDTADWCLSDHGPAWCPKTRGPQSLHALEDNLEKLLHTPKKDGLLMLEHELSFAAVAGFEFILPLMKKLGWKPKPIPDLFNATWYQN